MFDLILHSPYTWLLLISFFCGWALSVLTRPAKQSKDEEKARNIKWIKVCIYFSIAVFFLILGIFFLTDKRLLDIHLLYFFLISVAFFFLAMRFKKAFGIPATILFFTTAVLFILFLQSLMAFTGETEIGRINVLSSDKEGMVLEIQSVNQEPVINKFEGDYFAPVVKVIIFEDYWVFLGFKSWYRFLGVISFKMVKDNDLMKPVQTESEYYYDFPSGISEAMYHFFEENERYIPGIKTVQISIELKHVDLKDDRLRVYSLMLQNDGGLQIVDVSD